MSTSPVISSSSSIHLSPASSTATRGTFCNSRPLQRSIFVSRTCYNMYTVNGFQLDSRSLDEPIKSFFLILLID